MSSTDIYIDSTYVESMIDSPLIRSVAIAFNVSHGTCCMTLRFPCQKQIKRALVALLGILGRPPPQVYIDLILQGKYNAVENAHGLMRIQFQIHCCLVPHVRVSCLLCSVQFRVLVGNIHSVLPDGFEIQVSPPLSTADAPSLSLIPGRETETDSSSLPWDIQAAPTHSILTILVVLGN